MRLKARTRTALVESVNGRLAARAERRVLDWEFADVLDRVDETTYQDIDEFWQTDDPQDERRSEFNDAAEWVVEAVLIGRRHTEHSLEIEESERGMRTEAETIRDAAFAGYYSYHPPWWERELMAWHENWRPLQAEALALVAPTSPNPLPPQDVAKTMKRIALEELAPGESVRVKFPFEETFHRTVRSRWVRLRGSEPQLSLLEPAPPRPGTHRLQRLMDLAQILATKADCTEQQALGFLLCDIPIPHVAVDAIGLERDRQRFVDIRVNSLDVPADVVAAAYKDARSSLGVRRARAVPRQSDWPSIIFAFVEARTPPRGKRDWVRIFEEFKADPAHAECPSAKSDNRRSFGQIYFREKRRRCGRPAVMD